jgi:hypothetical protein
MIKKNSILFANKEKLEEKMSKIFKKLPTVTSSRDIVTQKENTNTLDKLYKIASFQPENSVTGRISKLQNVNLNKCNSLQKESYRFSLINNRESMVGKESNFIFDFVEDLKENIKKNLEKKLDVLSNKSIYIIKIR